MDPLELEICSSRFLDGRYPVDACQGFPMELTPHGWPCCVVRILEECGFLIQCLLMIVL